MAMTENFFIRRPEPKNSVGFRTPGPKGNIFIVFIRINPEREEVIAPTEKVETGFLLYLRGGDQRIPSSWMQGKGILNER